MLNKPLRKPRATASPVKMSGVAARMVSLTGRKASLIWSALPDVNASAYVTGLPSAPPIEGTVAVEDGPE